MKKISWVLVFGLACLFVSDAQPVDRLTDRLSIKVDLGNALETIRLLETKGVDDKEWADWLMLPGTRAILQKLGFSPETVKLAMEKTINGVPLTPDEKKLQYETIIRQLPDMKNLVKQLEQTKDSALSVLVTELAAYLPEGKSAAITLYGLMGTHSAGFAFPKDPLSFYIGLHFYKNDLTAVWHTAKHELFHNIQSIAYAYEPVMEKLTAVNAAFEAPYYLIRHLYLEGAAQYFADGTPWTDQSPYLKREAEQEKVNVYRHDQVFYLFERMILDAYQNSNQMNFGNLYGILFDWNWNNPAYYAGKQIMTALLKKNGDAYLKKSLEKDALYFLADYMELAKEPGTSYYRFSEDFEQLVNHMIEKL